MGRKAGLVFVAVAIVSVGAFALWRRFRTPPPPPRYNVILLTVDALRADRLGVYGYPRSTSPAIDALGRQSVVFQNAYCLVPKTSGSFATIMTGLHPFLHGVSPVRSRLAKEFRTLAEAFADHGYNTCGIVDNANLSRHFGFAQGFDSYTETWNEDKEKDESAKFITQRAVDFLRGPNIKPFFLWVHYIDPHVPYQPPPAFLQYDPKDAGRDILKIGDPLIMGTTNERQIMADVNPHEGYFSALYDAEIRYVDQCIRRVLEQVDRRYAGNTIVIFAADHGEELGEHNVFFGHGPVTFETSTHVPLMMRMPGRAHETIRDPVCLPDIYSTVLEDVLHETLPGGLTGISLLRSRPDRELLIYGQAGHTVVSGSRYIVKMDDLDLMKQVGLSELECYDIFRTDASRLQLVSLQGDEVSLMDGRYLAFLKAHPYPPLKQIPESALPQQDLKQLKALGYIN